MWYLPILLNRKMVSNMFNEVFDEKMISQQMDDDERRKGKKGQIGFLGFVAAYLFQAITRLFIAVLWSPKS